MAIVICSDNIVDFNMLNMIYLAALGAISMLKEYISKLTSVINLTYGDVTGSWMSWSNYRKENKKGHGVFKVMTYWTDYENTPFGSWILMGPQLRSGNTLASNLWGGGPHHGLTWESW